MSLAPTPLSRILGVLGALGGIALLAAFFSVIPSDVNYIRIFLFLSGGVAVVIAVYLRQRATAPRLALIGALPAVVLGSWLFVMEVLLVGREPPAFGGTFGWVFFWASLSAWLAFSWFGVVALWIGHVTRLGAGALAVGALLGTLGIDRLGLVQPGVENVFSILALSGIFVHGLGLVLLGLEVALRARRAPPAAAA
ncbi:MAG TPA: hypothetical protein VH741_07545 [Candidatus Limnocylindrales bacterium]